MYVQYLDEQNIKSVLHSYLNTKISMRQMHAYTSDHYREFVDAGHTSVRFNLHCSAHDALWISLSPTFNSDITK